MKKGIKIFLFVLLGLFVLVAISMGLFAYKAVYGFPFYDATPPILPSERKDFSILHFTKTNGFRHGSAIKESTVQLEKMAASNGWSIFSTDNGAIFNTEQLPLFDLVIWNNVTGKNLDPDQRVAFKNYMENGGGFLGIHGTGDFSHQWKWYEETLIGASFSHHPMNPQIQSADMYLECDTSQEFNCQDLSSKWTRSDEWYVFLDNPRKKGFTILYTVDENTFNPSGNMKYLVSNKDFGMGKDHPIVWYKCLPNGGRTFYSALGHDGTFFKEPEHLELLKRGILWAGKKKGSCRLIKKDLEWSEN